MRRLAIAIFALIVFGFALALALVNLSYVSVNYLFGTVSVRLAVILALVLILGAMLGALCTLPAILKARVQTRRARARLGEVETEVQNLRRLPLRDAR